MTKQEIAVLLTCKGKAIRDFTIGAFVASGAVWAGICICVVHLVLFNLNCLLWSAMWVNPHCVVSCFVSISKLLTLLKIRTIGTRIIYHLVPLELV